jgi:hypothetical protein
LRELADKLQRIGVCDDRREAEMVVIRLVLAWPTAGDQVRATLGQEPLWAKDLPWL